MYCQFCGSPHVRNSHLRPADIPRLSLLQYPVRCRSCDGRYFASIFAALKLRSRAKARRDERRRRESDSA
jgi:hypothetical protein